MKPLRVRIGDAAQQLNLPQHVVEKDYVLSYLLAGIAGHPVLGQVLVCKGGTALKKLYFGDYRFSEDLDLSGVEAPRGETLEQALRRATGETARLLSAHGPFTLQLERYLERDPHPQAQEAFTCRVQFPWHPTPLCRVKLEITHDEPVLLAPEARRLLHEYGEDLSGSVLCYRIEEIVAEKLRALLQTHQRLVVRGWSRPRVRDYYDLWRVLDAFGPAIDPKLFRPLLERKCGHRGVAFQRLDDFFTDELMSEARLRWDASLRPFVPELPACQKVLDELKALLRPLLPGLG